MEKSWWFNGEFYEEVDRPPQWRPPAADAVESGKDKPAGRREGHGKPEKKQTREEMIRALQGIFCKGRYRSWVRR
jgi:hypothetical protein